MYMATFVLAVKRECFYTYVSWMYLDVQFHFSVHIFSESFVLASSQHKITDMNLGIDASAIKCTRS